VKKTFINILIVVFIFMLSGCVTPKNSASIPNFKKEYKTKRNIIIVPPSVKMYEVSAAGEEEIQEWTKEAIYNMEISISKKISEKNLLNHKVLALDSLNNEEKNLILSSNNLMYRIAPSINYHALNRSIAKFDEKIKNFDYSIGDSLSKISEDGDLYLFVNGFDKVQSSGKKGVEVAKMIVGALFGIAAGNFGGLTYSTMSLVDGKTGKILWYNYYISQGQVDLREEKGTDAVIEVLLNDLQNTI